MFKNALISVSDKTGLVEFLKPLVANGLRVVSTGGTLKHLREAGFEVVEISEQTGFPEVMGGRVKTLHPRVHMPILARLGNSEDEALLEKERLMPFDLVIVNLYPFASALKRNLSDHEMIEFIDIGGPSLLRAAAKNHDRLAVVCEPEDYAWIAGKKELEPSDRRRLAARVFRHTARYDDLIAKYLAVQDECPDTLVGNLVSELRYGENPQQKAWWYQRHEAGAGLHDAQILHGKPLSYNNILDLDAAIAAVRDFKGPTAVAVKHTNPCGVGSAQTIGGAVTRAIAADPVSVFGGIIALNQTVDLVAAEEMAKLFLECIVAPGFSQTALERLKKKKDLRILFWPEMTRQQNERMFRSISGGFLVQTSDQVGGLGADWKILGESLPEQIKSDLLFAWTLVAHLKSNAIAIAANGSSLGLGMGQVNRVDAVEQAITRMKKNHPDFGKSSAATMGHQVLASDAFFPFPDSVELAAQAGVRWIIQPGGSIRDDEVLARARDLGVTMVLTGARHFRH